MNLEIYFPSKNARQSRKTDSAIENNLKIKFVKTNELDECREKIAKMTELDTPSNNALIAKKRTKKLLR
jgi:hypothetical protein